MGVISTGRSYATDAMAGMRKAGELEGSREQTERSLKAAEKAQMVNSISSGIGTGAAIGFMAGGPIGAGIGALAGGGLGYITSSLF